MSPSSEDINDAAYKILNDYNDDIEADLGLDDHSPLKMPAKRHALTQQEEHEAAKKRNLMIAFFMMLFIGFGNKVTQTFVPTALYNYPLFVNLFTTFMYVPMSFLYIIPMIKFGKEITPEQTALPKMKFAVMGLLDGISGIMMSLAVTYLADNSSLYILLQQAAIPISMIISRILLKTKYTNSQLIGAGVVALGLVIALVPQLINQDGHSGHSHSIAIWSFVMILACVPMTLSSVYKEIALGATEIDPIYLNGWVAVFQFLISIPLLYPAAPTCGLPMSTQAIWDNLKDGTTCFFLGENHIFCDPNDDECTPDQCGKAASLLSIYLVFNILYNILIILMLKYGSANLLWLAMTIMVPLASAAFALPFMINYKPLQVTDVIGLLVICIGLFLYRFWNDKMKKKMTQCCASEEDSTINGGRQGITDSPMFFKTPSQSSTFTSVGGVGTPELGGAGGKHMVRPHKKERSDNWDEEEVLVPTVKPKHSSRVPVDFDA